MKLAEPVLHYGFLESILMILQCVCHRCYRLKRSSVFFINIQDKDQINKIKEIRKSSDHQKRLLLMSKLLKGLKKCNKKA